MYICKQPCIHFKVFYTQNLLSLDAASATEYDVTREPAFYTPETKLLSAESNPFKFHLLVAK